MSAPWTPDRCMEKGDVLARGLRSAQLPGNVVGLVLSHLRRHRDPAATRKLLAALPRSPFGQRSQRTREQFESLKRLCEPDLKAAPDWQSAAAVVGWAKRLMAGPGE